MSIFSQDDPDTTRKNLQRKQTQLIDEDAKRRRIEKTYEEKRRELERTEKEREQKERDIINLKKKEFDLKKQMTTLDRDLANQKNRIQKMEFDSEQYRQKNFRRDRGTANKNDEQEGSPQ